jgi:DTW domain-containing protein YfiP
MMDMSEMASRLEEEVEEDTGRVNCSNCNRPQKVCLCSSFPPGGPVESDCQVVMLMHPLEIKRKIRTGHLCKHILSKVGAGFPASRI